MANNIYKPTLAKPLHRLAAFLIDAVAFVILFTGVLYLASLIFDFDTHYANLIEEYKKIGYYIYNETAKKWEYLSTEAENYKQVTELLLSNKVIEEELFFVNSFSVKAPLASTAIVLVILEFIIPLFLRNGATLGMKVFHIGLISKNDLRINPLQLFARCFIGKIAILGIIPVLGILYIFLSPSGGLLGTLMVLLVYGIQAFLLITNQNKAGIQDIISSVYPVDANETMFYKNEKEKQQASNQLSRSKGK